MNILPTIMTASGRHFDFLDPKPESIDIEDIAQHLSKLCRFTGATSQFYSVAQHSVYVAALVPELYWLQGLLHDATEAYVGDVSRPLKQLLPDYKVIEHRTWLAIAAKFNLPEELHPSVKEADNVMLMTEKRDLMHLSPQRKAQDAWDWASEIKPLGTTIEAWDHRYAYERFMLVFRRLTALR